MRNSLFFTLAAGLAKLVLAEDLLFVDTLKYVEYTEATTKLGYSAKVVTEAEWRGMSTADFAAFKAIIISDPNCVEDPSPVKFLEDTKNTWSPAVKGNIVLIGTDPTWHSDVQPGATTLIDNSVSFAASGGATGLYFSLSCYYGSVDSASVDALSEFGKFTVRGNLECYNNAHIVASSPALATLTDTALSEWSCSVHEAFSEYPTSGVGGFQALAIAKDILGVGSQEFGDGTSGLPYIISRGAIPAGCGDGVYDSKFSEECDHGSANGSPGDLCDKSCKCLYGVLDADAGTCKPAPKDTPGSSSGIPTGYRNATTSVPYPVSTRTSTTISTTTAPGHTIIGIEIIVIVEIVTVCPEGSTVTTTITTCLSTLQRPIYATSTAGYPCYVCIFGAPEPTDFMTVTTTSCPSKPDPTPTVTVKKCSACAETTVTTATIPGCTPTNPACPGCTPFVVAPPHEHSQAPSTNPAGPVTTPLAWATTLAPSVTGSGKVPGAAPTTTAKFVTAGAPRVAVGGVLAAGIFAFVAAVL